MKTIFLISDTHFGHANILGFTREDGSPVRPFKTMEEMNETMIERWNAVVKPYDHVYHVGDVVINKRFLPLLARCNGHKRLVRGNHDIFKTKQYLEFFEEIHGARVYHDLIMTHIPIHPGSLRGNWTNVHGHLHNNQPALALGPRYFNVSVEMINYTPISIEEIEAHVKNGTRPEVA